MAISAAGARSRPVIQWTVKKDKKDKKNQPCWAQKSTHIANLNLILILLNSLNKQIFLGSCSSFFWLSLWSFHMSLFFLFPFLQSYAHVWGAYYVCLQRGTYTHWRLDLYNEYRSWPLQYLTTFDEEVTCHHSIWIIVQKMWCVSLLAV